MDEKESFNGRSTVKKSTLNFFSLENRQFLTVINGQDEVEEFFLGKRPFLAVINGGTEVKKFFF